MDYEKKYKNALEWARQVMNGETGFIREEVEEVFPELKESEDEKIRQKLIKLVKMSSEVGGFALHKWEADKMLAWLEKQVPKNKTALDKAVEEEVDAWLKKQEQVKEYTFKMIPRLLEMVEPTERAKAYCQKLIDTLIKEGYVTDAKIVGECLKKMNGNDVSIAIMDEKQGKSKWTEEDECYMGECISAIATKDCWSFEEKRKTKDWLKSFKQRMEEQQ